MSQSPTVADLALQASRYPSATRTVPATPWTDLPIGGGWAPLAEVPQVRIDSAGNVELRGRISGGAPFTVFATLDPGFRPPVLRLFPATGFLGGAYVVINVLIEDSGQVQTPKFSAAVDWLSLDGIRFSVF